MVPLLYDYCFVRNVAIFSRTASTECVEQPGQVFSKVQSGLEYRIFFIVTSCNNVLKQ